MTTKVSAVNEHSTSFMGGILDISPIFFDLETYIQRNGMCVILLTGVQ
jgi:hypothetical protein